MTSTDLAVVDGGSLIALNHTIDEIRGIIQSNFDKEEISPFDLDRVGIPPGGGTNWIVPGINGEQPQPELSGVVIHHKMVRAYWPGEFQGGEPPQCSSPDAIVGYGNPGIECAKCPHAQFRSPEIDGKRGQACKLQEQWFLLTDQSLLPLVVNMPPGSLKQAKQYRLRLAGAMLRLDQVVTRLALDTTKNADGIKYSFAVPELAGRLSDEDAARAKAYGDMLRPTLDRAPAVVPTPTDNGHGGPSPEEVEEARDRAYGPDMPE